MRAVVQRVRQAEVSVEGRPVGRIGQGLLVYAGVAQGDTPDDLRYIADKIRHLRIFADSDGRMNLDVSQVGGEILLVSNFTLLGDARQGRRPDFTQAAAAEHAEAVYQQLCAALRAEGLTVATGRFRAMMEVQSVNDGPINILLDSGRLL